MQMICSENMQKYAVLYATYAEVHILHILHLCAIMIPTLLLILLSMTNSLPQRIYTASP